MQDLRRDISLLVQVAKVEASLHANRTELQRLPKIIATLEKRIADLATREKAEIERFDGMQKERRAIEQDLDDHAAQITKLKNQLMQVKTNKEYTAMLKEISDLEKQIDSKEERLLVLMDELETHRDDHEKQLEKIVGERKDLERQKQEYEAREKELQAQVDSLAAEKPKTLSEVDASIRRRYDRLFERHGDLAVTRVESEHCGGCGTQLPPQVAVEVRKNDQLITCQSCGRILIHYSE